MEKKLDTQHAVLLTHIGEKDFTFSDQMSLSSGREGAAELLSHRADAAVTETKIVGGKLLFKGIFQVDLLYRTADGRCQAASGELPFSQLLELEGAAEGAEACVLLQITGADLQIDGGDEEGREIAVTLYAHAAALVRRSQELTLLSDLYSTAYDLTYEARPLELTAFHQSLTRRQNVRETLEIGVVAESVLAVTVTCEPCPSRERERPRSCGPARRSGPCIWMRVAYPWWPSSDVWMSPVSWICRRAAMWPRRPSAGQRCRAA